MKSNQERSNECLPPKKREIPSSTLLADHRSPFMPPATDSQRTENMAWLASVAGGHDSGVGGHRSSSHCEGAQTKTLFSTSDSSSTSSSLRLVSSLPTVYTSPMSQSTVGGTVHYTQLPPNLQFIASPYSAPYAGYISPQLLPPPPPPLPLSSSLATQRPLHTATVCAPSHASKHDHQRTTIGRTSMPPPPTDLAPHQIQMSTATRTVPSPHHQHQEGLHFAPQSLHPHHTLGQGMSQVLVQYTDAPSRKEEVNSRPRELHNGELDRGQRFGKSSESILSKPGSKSRDTTSSLSTYEARQLLLPSDYSHHDPSGLRNSVMLVPNSHGDHQLIHRVSPERLAPSTPVHLEKGNILLGKPVNHTPSISNTTSSFTFSPPMGVNSLKAAVSTLSPQTVIHTTHNATHSLSMGLPSTGIYPQPPIIGYIAGGNGSQHTPIGYHTSMQQHLLIPGAQPVIIPVSGGGVTTFEHATSQVTSSTQDTMFPTTLPHTYVAARTLKGETLETSSGSYHQASAGAVVQAQLHLPMVQAQQGLVAPSAPPTPSSTVVPPSLPPYFIKGSIIQLADGELKRVEDLKTEDFIQSAEISSELKIDASTVERVEGSHASPNYAVVQFSVGEHRAQVSVEVLVEYPFFVFGQGWSSCCPDRTTQLLELPCTKLSVGDVCISLTLKNLKNGSLKKTTQASVPAFSQGHVKSNRGDPPQSCSGGGPRHSEWENGISQRPGNESGRGATGENGDITLGAVFKGPVANGAKTGPSKPSGSRKRRWSAPEGRKVEKSEAEQPLTLPKPSFISHEVKVSIEGRSNIGM